MNAIQTESINIFNNKIIFIHFSYLQREVDREQSNHAENLHDDKIEYKLGRDFRNLSHHPSMVHLHTGIEHLSNADVEVSLYTRFFSYSRMKRC